MECQNASADKKRDNYKRKKKGKSLRFLADTNQLSLEISGLRFIHYTKSKHLPLTKKIYFEINTKETKFAY